MGISPTALPERFVQLMDEKARKDIGKWGMTRDEEQAKFERGEELKEQKHYLAWLKFHRLPYQHSATNRKTTNVIGFPDFAVYHKDRFLWIEFKATDGRLSEAQELHMDLGRENGIETYICHSATAAIELTKRILRLTL